MKDGSGVQTAVYAATAGAAAAAAATIGFWQHYNENVATPPRIWLADGPLRERVLPHCHALLRSFAPTPWAANTHAQTVLGFMRTLTMRNRYHRQLILAVDGATLGLDWFDCCDGPDFPAPLSAPVLLVCHGINGGSHEGYAKWVCAAALARGWRAVVLNYRGCNGLPFTAPRGYAATMSHDVFTAVYSVKARYPSAPLLAVGYSLGGLKLTKYLAEADAGLHVPAPSQPRLFAGSGLAAAAVVSSPISLSRSAEKLSDRTSVSFLYNLAVAYKLREHIARHKRDIQAHTRFDVDAALSAWTVGEIEERGLPASLGFADRQQYYEEASSPEYIPAITTPTLVLLAEDDPFLGVVPDVECSRNPSTLLALTRRGGHVAFLQGAWPLGRSYMDDAVLEFFAATLEHMRGIDPRTGGPLAAAPPQAPPAAEGPPPQAPPQAEPGAGTAPGAAVGVAAEAEEPLPAPAIPDAMRGGALAAAMAAVARSCGGHHHCDQAHHHCYQHQHQHAHQQEHRHQHEHEHDQPGADVGQGGQARRGTSGGGGRPEGKTGVTRSGPTAHHAAAKASVAAPHGGAQHPPRPHSWLSAAAVPYGKDAAAMTAAAADLAAVRVRHQQQVTALTGWQRRLEAERLSLAAAAARAAEAGGSGTASAPGAVGAKQQTRSRL